MNFIYEYKKRRDEFKKTAVELKSRYDFSKDSSFLKIYTDNKIVLVENYLKLNLTPEKEQNWLDKLLFGKNPNDHAKKTYFRSESWHKTIVINGYIYMQIQHNDCDMLIKISEYKNLDIYHNFYGYLASPNECSSFSQYPSFVGYNFLCESTQIGHVIYVDKHNQCYDIDGENLEKNIKEFKEKTGK